MSLFNYIYKSLRFYKKQNLAILLGTALSTAVLTGALVVGDSVRFSLNQLVEKRLGQVDFALQAKERFVTDSLSIKLAQNLSLNATGILSVKGMAINPDSDTRIAAVDVLGIDASFWAMSLVEKKELKADEVFISENIAERLQLKMGDELLIRVQNIDAIPVNAPFAQDKNPSVSFRLTVKEILNDPNFGRYSLKSNQKAPYNVLISKKLLQHRMKLNAKVNTILLSDKNKDLNQQQIHEVLNQVFTLQDAALLINASEDSKHIELNSERVFIDYSLSDKLVSHFKSQAILTYLVNSLRFKDGEIPYSFVSGVSEGLLNQKLQDNEIILNQWCANDLGLQIGDSLALDYFVIGPYRKLENQSKLFVVKGIEPNQGSLFHKDLMPNFPGLSDAESCGDWDTGVPIDLDIIRDKDEEYWNEFKGTPKALIAIETATQLWGNPYGSYTAIRFSESAISKKEWAPQLAALINADDIGLHFVDVRNRGQKAANNSVDFGELFLSLSFFVIAAAILLLILLHVLNIVSRKKEIGILTALGFTRQKIVRLFMMEAFVSIAMGGALGALLGILYNKLLLLGLNTVWQGAVRTHELQGHINVGTLCIGFVSGLSIAILSIYFVIRKQINASVTDTIKKTRHAKFSFKKDVRLAGLAFASAAVLVGYSIVSHQIQNASLFLGAGGIILIALIALLSAYLKKQVLSTPRASFGINALALKNLSRNRARTLMAVALLALGTFSVIITGANRKTFSGANEQRQSGTGGFLYWVETSLPITHNLNSEEGQANFNFVDEGLADSMEFIQLLTLDGDDASCLNLNQVQQPQILGINPELLNKRSAFSFAQKLDGIDEEKPWLHLNADYEGDVIPAYIDQTVITWGLMKKVGDTLWYNDEAGKDLKLVIAGGLNSSVFQGNILISERNFRTYFPSVAGSKVMLIDAKQPQAPRIAEFMDFYFRDYGVEYSLCNRRLAEFNSITNTYLNVFMMLGGLGLLIGTLGFGIVLLRNKQERSSELALLSAIGIKNNSLFRLVFLEHFIILLLGLFSGILAACVGMLPSMLSVTYAVPVVFIAFILLLILLNGIAWIYISARFSKHTNLMGSLRVE